MNLIRTASKLGIRERIGKYLLHRKSPLYPQAGFQGWHKVERVVMVGEVNDFWTAKSWLALREVIRHEDKSLHAIMIDRQLQEKTEGSLKHFQIGKKGLNFWHLPQSELLEEYQRTPYDLLICLSHEPSLAVQFLYNRLPANFRIGLSNSEDMSFDLVVHRPKEMSPVAYLQELIRYLKRINTPPEK